MSELATKLQESIVIGDLEKRCEIVRCGSESEWIGQRSQSIGGSSSAKVLGLSSYGSPMSLYAEMRGLVDLSQEENEYLEWGRHLEQPIAEKYHEKTGRQLIDLGRHTIIRSKSEPWMTCTLDRVIFEKRLGALEIKNVNEYKRDDWEDDEDEQQDAQVDPPLQHQVQLQHQLAVTGWEYGSIAALIGGHHFVWVDIPRNEGFIKLLKDRTQEFWERVQRGEEPPADGHHATAKALQALHPRDNGLCIEFGPDVCNVDARFAEVSEQMKALKAERKTLRNHLAAMFGDATEAKLPNGVRLTYKTTDRRGYTVEPTSFRQLRRIAR